MPPEAVDADTLPFFSQLPCCERCGGRGEIRVHFDRDCELAPLWDELVEAGMIAPTETLN